MVPSRCLCFCSGLSWDASSRPTNMEWWEHPARRLQCRILVQPAYRHVRLSAPFLLRSAHRPVLSRARTHPIGTLLLSCHSHCQPRHGTGSLSIPQPEGAPASSFGYHCPRGFGLLGHHTRLLRLLLLGHRHTKPYLPDYGDALHVVFLALATHVPHRLPSAEAAFCLQ